MPQKTQKIYTLQTAEGLVIATHIVKAQSFWSRAKGLLGHSHLQAHEGMWLAPCNSIHTFFMKFAIDVIFINQKNQVISTLLQLPPGRLSWIYWRAHSCIELAAGTLNQTTLKPGQQILLKEQQLVS